MQSFLFSKKGGIKMQLIKMLLGIVQQNCCQQKCCRTNMGDFFNGLKRSDTICQL